MRDDTASSNMAVFSFRENSAVSRLLGLACTHSSMQDQYRSSVGRMMQLCLLAVPRDPLKMLTSILAR